MQCDYLSNPNRRLGTYLSEELSPREANVINATLVNVYRGH